MRCPDKLSARYAGLRSISIKRGDHGGNNNGKLPVTK